MENNPTGDSVARGRWTTASKSLPTEPSAAAVDGSYDSTWGTGEKPPHWIEIDLAGTERLREIRLRLSQNRPGETAHRIFGSIPGGPTLLLAELRGFTWDNDVLVARAEPSWDGAIRFIRVETIESPGLVAFREIEVFRAGDPPSNLARDKRTAASRSALSQPSASVVDGDWDTSWGAGDGPPQWIEVDLGQGHRIGEIRLALRQDRPGETTHRVLSLLPGVAPRLLQQFQGFTRDGDVLVARPEPSWEDALVKTIRVETVSSPPGCTVAFREIEVLPAPDGAPSLAPRVNLALHQATQASAGLEKQPSGVVVDGSLASSWETGDAPPQWIEIDLGKARLVDGIRLHLKQTLPGETTHRIFASYPGAPRRLLKAWNGTTKDGAVLTAWAEPWWQDAPIRVVRIETTKSPGPVAFREIEVLGPPPTRAPASLVNVARGKRTTSSRSLKEPSAHAVDGSSDSFWTPKDLPPQWIEIDLDRPERLAEIRLHLRQRVAGRTVHRIFGGSPGSVSRQLAELRGFTRDGDVLVARTDPSSSSWHDAAFQSVRVETVSAPGPVGFREIEALARPSMSSTTTWVNVAKGMRTGASTSVDTQPSSAAVDGSLRTAWRAGEAAPQWIEVDFEDHERIGEIRLALAQQHDGETVHRILGLFPGEPPRLLRDLRGLTRDGDLLVVRPESSSSWGDAIFTGLRVETRKTAGWTGFREIEVLAPLVRPRNLVDVARGKPLAASPKNARPPWLEVDLGRAERVEQIRLHLSQPVAGETVHRLLNLVPGGTPRLLRELRGSTTDRQVLIAWPDPSWNEADIRRIRVETVASPGPVSVREIEVLARTTADRPTGLVNLAKGMPVTASPSAEGPPSAAVDGSAATVWRARAGAAPWIAIDLGAPRRIDEIRLQPYVEAGAPGETIHRVLGMFPGSQPRLLEELRGVDVLVARARPSWDRVVQIVRVETVKSAGSAGFREIELLSYPRRPSDLENLAKNRITHSELGVAGHPSRLAVDGLHDTSWESGLAPPQSFEVDLGEPRRIGEIRLHLSQSKPGETAIRILGRFAGARPRMLKEFHGFTSDGDVLVARTEPSWDQIIQMVRILILKTPGTVGIREIEVLPPRMTIPGLVDVARGRPMRFEPQWTEIDLGEPRQVSEIRLHLRQAQAGETVFRIVASGRVLTELRGFTTDGDVLLAPAEPSWQPIRVVRIETGKSPGALRFEPIEVLAPAR